MELALNDVRTIDATDAELFVLEVPDRLDNDDFERFQKTWRDATKGTSIEGRNVIVLEHGATLRAIVKTTS